MLLKKISFFILIFVNPLLASERGSHTVSYLIEQSMQILDKLDTIKRHTRSSPFSHLKNLSPTNKENYRYIAHQAHVIISKMPLFETIKIARESGNTTVQENYYELLNTISKLQMIGKVGITVYNQFQQQIQALNLLYFFHKNKSIQLKTPKL